MILILFLTMTLSPLQADEEISPALLDQTVLDAQQAIEAQDYETAFKMYQKAAQWGHKGSQYVLGELYLRGKGVAKDPVLGAAWLEVAAEAPDRNFRKARTSALKQLSDPQKTKAEQLAQKLAAAYGMEAAGVDCRKEAMLGTNIKTVNCTHQRITAEGNLVVPDYEAGLYPAS